MKNIKIGLKTLVDKMDKETREWISNVDAWLKDVIQMIKEIKLSEAVIKETVDNTQHNYELIYELKEQIDSLREDIRAVKIIQLTMMKEKLHKPGPPGGIS